MNPIEPQETQVQIQTPFGYLETNGEIVGPLAVADITPFMPHEQEAYGVVHLITGLGLAAFRDKEIAMAFASSICEVEWDDIFARVMQGVHMDDMKELPELLEIFNRSLHDSHTIIPLVCAPYTPTEIVEWVENHHRGIMGEQN